MRVEHQIEVQVEEQVGELDTAPIYEAVAATLAQQQIAEPCEVVVVVSDDETLRDLNRRFRNTNRPTDVLSFANDTKGPFAGGVGGFPRYLGDVVISIERARAQAEAAGGMLDEELQLLTVHGVLHLLGYDHGEPDEKAAMWAAQNAVLDTLGVDIPLPE